MHKRTHARTLTHMPAHTHLIVVILSLPYAHTYAHANTRAHAHAQTHTSLLYSHFPVLFQLSLAFSFFLSFEIFIYNELRNGLGCFVCNPATAQLRMSHKCASTAPSRIQTVMVNSHASNRAWGIQSLTVMRWWYTFWS